MLKKHCEICEELIKEEHIYFKTIIWKQDDYSGRAEENERDYHICPNCWSKILALKKAPEVEAQELSNQICNGQKTLNQAREELGLEPLEECDKLFTTAQCCKKCED